MSSVSKPGKTVDSLTTIKVPEPAIKASYGFKIFHKTYRIHTAMSHIIQDAELLANYNLHSYFLQLQAFFSFSEQSQESSGPSFFQTFKDTVKVINHHPATIFFKTCLFWKQTCDFAVASYQWCRSQRSDESMFRNLVSTSLSYAPLLLSQTTKEQQAAQVLLNAVMFSALAYSLRQDFIQSADQSKREPSPAIELIKTEALPRIKNAALTAIAVLSHQIKNITT